MVSIEIKSAGVHEEEIRPSNKPGAKVFTPFMKRSQAGYVVLTGKDGQPDPYPVKIGVVLDEKQPAFAPGVYTLLSESFYVDRNGNLTLGRLRLKAYDSKQAALKSAA